MLFNKGSSNVGHLRYQLLTALCGTMLEAEHHYAELPIKTAMLIIVTFKKQGKYRGKPYYDDGKIKQNENDLRCFLNELSWNKATGEAVTNFGTANNMRDFVKSIEISI